MSKSQYINASDGRPARVSGPWAEDKLRALEKYSGIVLRAMRGKWRSLCYVDLLAGGGKCILKGVGREFDGSPLRALQFVDPAFTSVVLVESDGVLAAALRARTAGHQQRTTIIEADCNEASVIAKVRQAVPSDALSIIFVDNLGLDVALSTIRSIVFQRRMDLVVTFQVNDLNRNAGRALTNADAARWDRFFGTDGWRKVIEDFEAARIQAPDLGAALSDFYAEQLMTLGYETSTDMGRSMMNSRNAPLYRVMLFSRHPLAEKLFKAASHRQDSLFG